MYGLTDAYMRTQKGVAYPMQVNGLLPLTDTGPRTRMGVVWPLVLLIGDISW